MISKKTYKIFNIIITGGYYLRILPWIWDKKNRRKRVKTIKRKVDIYFWRHIGRLQIIGRILAFCYFCFTPLFRRIPAFERMFSFCLGGILFSTAMVLTIFQNGSTRYALTHLFNGLFLFNQKQLEFHGIHMKEVKEDYTGKFSQIVFVTIASLGVLTGPATYFLLSLDLEITWWTHYIYFPGLHAIVAIFAAVFGLTDCVIQIFIVNFIYVYGTTIILWLEKTICQGPFTPINTKAKLRIICRSHRVLHRYLDEFTYYIIPVLFTIGVVMITTMLYCLLDLYKILNSICLAWAAIVMVITSVALGMACDKANLWKTNSMLYKNSFLENDKFLTKYDYSFFKSVQPIIWHIGPLGYFHEAIHIEVMNFVISWVINMVVSFDTIQKRS